MPEDGDRIRVEVVAAWPHAQPIVSLTLAAGSRVEDAIRSSGLCETYPELEIQPDRIGIFGELCAPDRVLADGDRVELYRPLRADPKEARRRTAERATATDRSGSDPQGPDRRRD